MSTIPTSMKAAYIEETGPPEAIRYGDLPVPPVGPGDVLVRVDAVAVDPVDTYIRAGLYKTSLPLPFIIGRDLAGTVAAVGPRVTRFAPGARVWANSLGYDGRHGSFAEFAVVEEARLYPLPDRVDPLAAVATFHYAATAYTGLVQHARLRPNELVFVRGGAGNTGTAVLQVGLALGARVIVSASGEADLAWCRRWGAEAVIDYRQADVAAELARLAPQGVDIVWDTTGHYDLDLATGLLAPRGRIVVMAGMSARPALPVGPLYTRDGSVVGFAISNATVAELAQAAETINRMLTAGMLAERVTHTLTLAEAAEAHRLVAGAAGRPPAKGRVTLRV